MQQLGDFQSYPFGELAGLPAGALPVPRLLLQTPLITLTLPYVASAHFAQHGVQPKLSDHL